MSFIEKEKSNQGISSPTTQDIPTQSLPHTSPPPGCAAARGGSGRQRPRGQRQPHLGLPGHGSARQSGLVDVILLFLPGLVR